VGGGAETKPPTTYRNDSGEIGYMLKYTEAPASKGV
jgi:hypothetical protein